MSAAELFAQQLAADRVPSVHAVRAQDLVRRSLVAVALS
jgi:hypothetical protein